MVRHLNHLRRNEALAVAVCTVFFVIVYMMGIDITAAIVGTVSDCGNGACEVGENIINCKDDCTAVCGNSICESSEKITCPMDCKEGTATTNQYFATFEQISGCIKLIINIIRSG